MMDTYLRIKWIASLSYRLATDDNHVQTATNGSVKGKRDAKPNTINTIYTNSNMNYNTLILVKG